MARMLALLLTAVAFVAAPAAAAELIPNKNLAGAVVVGGSPAHHLNGAGVIVQAAAAVDPNAVACVTAGDVVTYCADTVPTDAPIADQASCYCCYDTTFLAPVYSSCENYIVSSAPAYTDDFSVVSIVQSYCLGVSQAGFSCGGVVATTTAAGATSYFQSQTPTPTPTTTRTTARNEVAPPACSSFASLYTSCEDSVRGFATMGDADAASCLCYKNGRFTTALDDYISKCAVWIKTAEPDEYETYVSLETFCEPYSSGGSATATASPTDAPATFGGSGDSSSDSVSSAPTATATKPTTTAGPKTVTVTPSPTSPAQNGAVGGSRGSGLAAWLAVVLPFVL